MDSGTVALIIILVVLVAGGVLAILLVKRSRDKERARIAGMSPAEREQHDAQIEYDTSIKASERALLLEQKARDARLKAAQRAVATANALGSRKVGSYRGKDGAVSVNELMISIQGRNFPLDPSVTASVDTAGNLATSSRTTFTRVAAGGLLFGPVGAIVGASAKKNKIHDNRELYLLIEGPGFAQLITCNPDDGAKVRQLAVAIRQAAINASAVAAHRAQQITQANGALEQETANTSSIEGAARELEAARSSTARLESASQRLAIESKSA